MTVVSEDLWLSPADLFDKYGFGDGDVGDDYVTEWMAGSWPMSELGLSWDDDVDYDHPVHMYCNSRALLARTIQLHLVPAMALPSGVRVHRVASVHSPFVLLAADGSYLEDVPDRVASQTVTRLREMRSVRVPAVEVARLCDEVFPRRRQGWLRLFGQLTWMFGFKEMTIPPAADPVLNMDTFRVGSFVDAFAAHLPDEVLGLAADMLASREGERSSFDPPVVTALLDEVLAAAQAAAVGPVRPGDRLPGVGQVCAALTPGLLPAFA